MVRYDPAEFLRAGKDYGALGFALATFSRFEHALDGFIWTVVTTCPKLPRTFASRPPHSFDEKLDFLRHCLLSIPQLRRVPMYDDGTVCWTTVFLIADEVVSLRRFLAHGAIYSTISADDRISSYTLTKWKKEGRTAIEESLRVGVVTLAEICDHATALEKLLVNYQRVLRGELDIEKEERKQREIRDNHKFLAKYGLLPEGWSVDMNDITIRLVSGRKDE